MLIDAIDKNRYIRLDNNAGDSAAISITHYNNFTSKLNDISRNINYLKVNLDDIRASSYVYNNESSNKLFGISNNLITYIALSTILLGEIVFLVLYFVNK